MKRLLAVFAHPDDETFICGGTLARCAAEGVHITLVCATKGEMGRRVGNPPFAHRESLPALREKELRDACAELGIADLRFLNIRDKMVECEDPQRLADRIRSVMEEVRPDAVLTFHERFGGHPDHCAIGKCTEAAFRQYGGNAKLYFVCWEGIGRHPERYGLSKDRIAAVDVGCCLAAKMRAFRCHRTQSDMMEWLWGPDDEAIRHFGATEYLIGDSRRFP